MSAAYREEMLNRIKEMNIDMEEVYKRERTYMEVIHDKEYKDCSVYVEDLGLTQCKASTKRMIKNPVRDKISIYTVFKYYINLGIVFRDKNKRYYTMEEVEQLLVR
ncbi:MAG: hypothetical protein RSB41_03795 [Bacilli bacterium]